MGTEYEKAAERPQIMARLPSDMSAWVVRLAAERDISNPRVLIAAALALVSLGPEAQDTRLLWARLIDDGYADFPAFLEAVAADDLRGLGQDVLARAIPKSPTDRGAD